MRTLIIDNYDSFTYNLYQYVGELDERPLVYRNDALTLEQVKALAPDRIIISPGPGSPDNPAYFGVCMRVIRELGPVLPVLGVCLGHQGIIAAFGGKVVRAPSPIHGKVYPIEHDGSEIFRGLPRRIDVMRYHSLVGDPSSMPDCLEVTAQTLEGNIIMGVRHREFPIYGIQFHPESIGTQTGKQMLRNFLDLSQTAYSRYPQASVA
ncbi:anthranilate synthase component II [Stigmatella aurantiaca]|uniref:Para-aminobenzoate/anthranilate synthase glutamine amidotransferasecomponent II n=1 Tax=Stigmatella aurantiaca (strain DW4/3-1) TaxID=378806 RepID=Q096N7_STIAD|nr:aminodeoxychorismate/anthranilate synthase component II [Stigmatella aurantiaca]ADO68586.1 Para-aminobenzoate/anthranilate synthase glutamine amidotransferasecomponent II [Stigmatella aurantiaca DW4/3-1]EAU67746.1 para-aminobenzoate/anthranilate synthase glutamine amidotransferasecomponent II [Stigmatella aurantiaca DW4/3-1]